ncbi:hypothetical protein CONLIGDRAFT_626358 [Coniochaeta ligniaria NRRL 30616]|uniref:Uncharacterized protein n=1 Tax=Coniochaeta ligniaria NRRL 30616 TaxID=1408157 RepID=A0A1J7JLS1_9PEZI|nr:hypothetical protein CONLIGDRAFT_626358 [Coniochaeta ligniaria NRRL 30616]
MDTFARYNPRATETGLFFASQPYPVVSGSCPAPPREYTLVSTQVSGGCYSRTLSDVLETVPSNFNESNT